MFFVKKIFKMSFGPKIHISFVLASLVELFLLIFFLYFLSKIYFGQNIYFCISVFCLEIALQKLQFLTFGHLDGMISIF